MSASCADLDRILESDDPELRSELERHALGCPDCRERLDMWDEISRLAPLLREKWETPGLRGRIEQALEETVLEEGPSRSGVAPSPAQSGRPGLRLISWRASSRTGIWLAAAAAFAIFLPLAWNAVNRQTGPAPEVERRLLTEKALDEVERNEETYIRSIERLSKLVGPALEKSGSPLVMNYREKLKLIDLAIAECRAQAEDNPFNAHLRGELLSMYQEKQRTLQTVLKETQGDL